MSSRRFLLQKGFLVAEKRKLPIRTRTIALNDDWAGWEFTARINPPLRTLIDLSSGDISRITEALAGLVKGWNFVDENGDPITEPSVETIGGLPVDLVTAMSQAYSGEINKVSPN